MYKKLLRIIPHVERFKSDQPFNGRLVTEGFWGVGGKISVMILSVIFNGLLARIISPSEMGELVYILSIVSVGVTIANFGLGPTSVRKIASYIGLGNWVEVKKSILDIATLGIFLGLGVSIIFGFIGEYIGINPKIRWLVALLLLMISFQELVSTMIRGFHKLKVVILLKGARVGGIISYSISILIFSILYFLNESITNRIVVLILIGGIIPALIWGTLYLWKNIKKINGSKFKKQILINFDILSESAPVLVYGIITLLITQASIWLLRALKSPTDIALYGIASQTVTLSNVQFSIIGFILSPSIAELYAQGNLKKIERIQRPIATLGSVISLITIIILIVFGRDILCFVFGEFYADSYPILLILSLGHFIQVITGTSSSVLLMTGNQNSLLKISLLSSMFSVLISWVLILHLSSVGAAIGTTIGLVVSELLMLLSVKRKLGIWTHITFRL